MTVYPVAVYLHAITFHKLASGFKELFAVSTNIIHFHLFFLKKNVTSVLE